MHKAEMDFNNGIALLHFIVFQTVYIVHYRYSTRLD
jgi:hypothetical protein